MAEMKEAPADAPMGVKLMTWLDNRFPTMFEEYRKHMSEYYAPKNFNVWYFFGSLAMVVLVIQIVTGIFLTMHYKPDAANAFASVEYIMRDVPGGWIIRYMHSTGASAFFIVVYLHMYRGLIYGSYRKPRELVWIFGCAIFLVLMAEAPAPPCRRTVAGEADGDVAPTVALGPHPHDVALLDLQPLHPAHRLQHPVDGVRRGRERAVDLLVRREGFPLLANDDRPGVEVALYAHGGQASSGAGRFLEARSHVLNRPSGLAVSHG